MANCLKYCIADYDVQASYVVTMVRTLRSKAPTDEPEDPPEKGKEEPKNDPKDFLNKVKAEESKRGGSGGRKKDAAADNNKKGEDKVEQMETGEAEGDSDSKKVAYGCQLAPKLQPGLKVTDARGNPWIIGRPIGSGGFGDIYLCDQGQEECPEDARLENIHFLMV